MKKISIIISLYLFACMQAVYEPLYFTFEGSKVCASKTTLIKLFSECISDSIGDEQVAMFTDYRTGIGSYILVKREGGCWEVVDLYPFSQKVVQARMVKLDSLVVWYELCKELLVTQSYKVTKDSVTPY